MKKLFIVLAVASLGFVACNNSGDKTETTDTTTTPEVPAVVDSAAAVVDSAAAAIVDSAAAGK